jgi:hypothetical protein
MTETARFLLRHDQVSSLRRRANGLISLCSCYSSISV